MDRDRPLQVANIPRALTPELAPHVSLTQTPLVPDPAHLRVQVEEAVVLEAQPERVPGLDALLHEAP